MLLAGCFGKHGDLERRGQVQGRGEPRGAAADDDDVKFELMAHNVLALLVPGSIVKSFASQKAVGIRTFYNIISLYTEATMIRISYHRIL
jgi:hypothetical protein